MVIIYVINTDIKIVAYKNLQVMELNDAHNLKVTVHVV